MSIRKRFLRIFKNATRTFFLFCEDYLFHSRGTKGKMGTVNIGKLGTEKGELPIACLGFVADVIPLGEPGLKREYFRILRELRY